MRYFEDPIFVKPPCGLNLDEFCRRPGYDFKTEVIEPALGEFRDVPGRNPGCYTGGWFYSPGPLLEKDAITNEKPDIRIGQRAVQDEEVKELARSADCLGYVIYTREEGLSLPLDV